MSIFDKKEPAQNLGQKHINTALSYEEDKELMFKRSNKIAWTIAALAIAFNVATVAIGGYFGKSIIEKVSEPKILGFDRSTGAFDYITTVNQGAIEELEGKEALDKFLVNNYIQIRESYTYQTIQKTYELTQLFSSDDVADQYRQEYDREDSLDKLLKTGTATVKVNSIVLEQISGENIATARIEVLYNEKEKLGEFKRNYTVRLSYTYKPEIELNLSSRMENPLGFFVTSYQRVQENL